MIGQSGNKIRFGSIAIAMALSLYCLPVTATFPLQTNDEEERGLWNKRFHDARERAGMKGKSPATKPHAPKMKSPEAPPREIVRAGRTEAVTEEEGLIGITIWRLSPWGQENRVMPVAGQEQSEARLLLPSVGNSSQPYRGRRVTDDMTFSNGDLVRMGIEVPRQGDSFVYVIDREVYNDGSVGEPFLIFPVQTSPVHTNIASAGKLVYVPALADPHPYFQLQSSRLQHIGERLTIIVSSQRLSLPGTLVSFGEGVRLLKLDASVVENWERQGEGKARRLEARSTLGASMTNAENEAGERRLLVPKDPLPQTIYGVKAKSDDMLLVTLSLRLR